MPDDKELAEINVNDLDVDDYGNLVVKNLDPETLEKLKAKIALSKDSMDDLSAIKYRIEAFI